MLVNCTWQAILIKSCDHLYNVDVRVHVHVHTNVCTCAPFAVITILCCSFQFTHRRRCLFKGDIYVCVKTLHTYIVCTVYIKNFPQTGKSTECLFLSFNHSATPVQHPFTSSPVSQPFKQALTCCLTIQKSCHDSVADCQPGLRIWLRQRLSAWRTEE